MASHEPRAGKRRPRGLSANAVHYEIAATMAVTLTSHRRKIDIQPKCNRTGGAGEWKYYFSGENRIAAMCTNSMYRCC